MMLHLATVMSRGRTSQFPFQTSQIGKQTNWNLLKTFKPRLNLLSFDPVGDSNFNVVCHLGSFLSLYLLILCVQGGHIALCALLVCSSCFCLPQVAQRNRCIWACKFVMIIFLNGLQVLYTRLFFRNECQSWHVSWNLKPRECNKVIYLYDKALHLDHLIFYIFILFLIIVYTYYYPIVVSDVRKSGKKIMCFTEWFPQCFKDPPGPIQVLSWYCWLYSLRCYLHLRTTL